MATAHSTPLKPATVPVRHPLEARAIGPVLACQQRLSRFQLTIETTAYGDTRAWLEPKAARAVRS